MWLIFVSGVLEPLFYLMAFRVGFGKLVGEVPGPDGRMISYLAFVAPALLASSAMNGAMFDSTFNVFFRLRYAKLYDAMLATPIGPLDVAIGEISWAVLRGGLYSVAFFGVLAAMGLVTSPWAVLLIPVALLIAFAFAAIGMTCVTFIRSPSQFDFINLAIMPMFLFSTTFYPLGETVTVLEGALQDAQAANDTDAGLRRGRARPGHARPSGLPGRTRRARGVRRVSADQPPVVAIAKVTPDPCTTCAHAGARAPSTRRSRRRVGYSKWPPRQ